MSTTLTPSCQYNKQKNAIRSLLTQPRSDGVQLRNDEHSDSLVKRRADAESLLIDVPVEPGYRLGRHRDVLQERNRSDHTLVAAFSVLHHPLARIVAEKKYGERYQLHEKWYF